MRAFICIATVIVLCFSQRSAAQICAELFRVNATSSELYVDKRNFVRITGLMPGDVVTLGTVSPEAADSSLITLWKLRPDLKDSNIYTFRICKRFRDTLFVRRQGKVVFSKEFRIESWGGWVTHIGLFVYKCQKAVTVGELLAYPRLFIEPGNLLSWMTIRSFEMDVQIKGSNVGPLHGNGDQLSQDQIEVIRQLHPGDRIWFENIRVVGGDATERIMNSIALMIK